MPVELRNYGAEGVDTGAQTMSQNIRDANAGTRHRQELANYIKQTALQNTVQLARDMLEVGTQKVRSVGPNGEVIEQTVISNPNIFNAVDSLYKGLQQGITSHVKDKNGTYIPTIDPRAGSHFMLDPDYTPQPEQGKKDEGRQPQQQQSPQQLPLLGISPSTSAIANSNKPIDYSNFWAVTGIQQPQLPNQNVKPPYAPSTPPPSYPVPPALNNANTQNNANIPALQNNIPFIPAGWLTNAIGFLQTVQNLAQAPQQKP